MDRYRELKKLVEELETQELQQIVSTGFVTPADTAPAPMPVEAAPVPVSYGGKMQLILEELHRMFLYKSSPAQYGTAFTQTGVLGAVVAVVGDVARLQQMVLRKDGHGRSNAVQVEDKLRDIAVQSIIGLMMLQEDNWEGKF